MRKKLLSLFVALSVMVVSFPVGVFAETGDTTAANETGSNETVQTDGTSGTSDNTGSETASGEDGTKGDESTGNTDGKTSSDNTTGTDATGTDGTGGEAGTGDVVTEEPEETATAAVSKITLKVKEKSKSSVTLTWELYDSEGTVITDTESLTGATCTIEYAGNTTTADLLSKTATITGLKTDIEYTFKISYTNEDETMVSASASITIKPTEPAAVTDFKAYSGYARVVLTWKKVSNATGYEIWRSTKAKSGFKKIKTISKVSTTTYTNKVSVNTKYYYRIYALNGSSKSSEYASVSDEAVRYMTYKITFKKTRTLKSHDSKKVTTKFKAGTTVTATGYKTGRYVFKYKGRTYYVTRISTKNQKVGQYSSKNYSKKEAEYFVNQKGLSSKTKYLIWVNTYTQQEFIFKGSKGKWKLVKQWDVATGKASTPTQTGTYRIVKKIARNNGLKYWNIVYKFSIHGKAGSWKLGYPASHACVRNTNEHAKWIFNTCPNKTTVCVY